MTDPRFDPAFQRGYSGPDPELVVREPVPSAPVPVAPEAAAVPAPVDASAQPQPQSQLQPASAAEPEPRPAVRNPYRLALLLVGVVLVLASGAALSALVQHPQASSTTADSQFQQLLLVDGPPVLALVGFVCVILWLALGALDRVDRPEGDRGAVGDSVDDTGA